MNTFKFSFLILAIALAFTSCDDDEPTVEPINFDYHAHVSEPTTEDKHVNDALTIAIDFESHTGETVHHVNVRIYNKADGTEIYNEPGDAHVHEESGEFKYTDTLMLSNDNGIEAHSDWILEAKVWAHEAGLAEVIETVEFHVHPE